MADQRMSTRQARWAVGDWILVVAPHGAILLSPEAPGTLDEDLWEQIHTDGVSLASVLDTLVMGAGGRLARIPDFGLVILGRDRVHLALRGGVVAEVDGARIDAEGVVTWYECRVASAESLALYAPGAADSAQARLHPVRDAVLPASAVHLSVAPSEAESVISSASADSAEEPVLTVVEEDAEAAAAAAAMAAMVAAAAQIEEAARQAEEAEEAARAEEAEEVARVEEGAEAARVARAIAQAEDAEALAQARAAEALAAVAAVERGEAAEPAEPEGPVGGSATSAESADDVAGGPSAHSAASAADAAPPASAPSAPSADNVAPAGPAGPPAPVVSPVSASSVPSADDDVFSVPSASPVSAASADEPAPAAALLGPSPRHAALPAAPSTASSGPVSAPSGPLPRHRHAAPPAEPEEEPAPSAASAAFADDDPTPVSGIIVPTDIPSPVEDSASTPQIIADVDHPLAEPSSPAGTGDDDPDDTDAAPAGGSTGDEPQLVDADRVPRAGDHDGWTVAELPAELVNELGQTLTGSEPGSDRSDRPVIDAPKESPTAPRTALSAICPEGHANPTNYVKCRECGRALAQPARVIICPPLGRVRTSTGEVVELDRPVLVGRAPAPSEVRGPGDSAPAVLTVPSPEQLVSRNHLLIELDEWSVLARNLSESNGTLLLREGEPARKIPSSEPVLLRAGDVLDLGDGQSLAMEDLP